MKILTKKKEEKILHEECWSLDYYLTKWLNTHLRVFLEDASKMVKLEEHKFEYKGEEKNLVELIHLLLVDTDILLENYYECDDLDEYNELTDISDEVYDIMKMIHFYLWW